MPDYLANKACHCTMASLQTQPRARLQSWSWCTDSSLNRVEHNLDAKCCVRNGSDASQSPGVLSSLGHGASRRVFFLRSNSSLSVKSFRLYHLRAICKPNKFKQNASKSIDSSHLAIGVLFLSFDLAQRKRRAGGIKPSHWSKSFSVSSL